MLHAMSGGKTPTLSMWGAANQALATLIRGLKGEGRKVIILCQEKLVAPTEDWVSEDDDEEVIASVTLDLPQGAARSLITMSDCIGRLYIANVKWQVPSAALAHTHTWCGRRSTICRI